MPRKIIVLVSLFLSFIIAACGGLAGEPEIVATLPPNMGGNQTASVSLIPPDTTPDLVLGASIFAEHCTRCHGITGAGDGEFVLSGQIKDVPDFTNPSTIQDRVPADFYTSVTQGRLEKLMPPFANELSDNERWAVANYVYQLSDGESLPEIPEHSTAAVPEAPVGDGIISGRIIQGTTDSAVPSDLIVVLHKLDMDGTNTAFERPIESDGTFEFTNIPIEESSGYYISAPYNEGVFNSELLIGNPDEPTMNVEITIYERTDDSDVIEIVGVTTQVDPLADGSARIIQQVRYRNLSDRLYIRKNAEGQGLSFIVPILQGAQLSVETNLSKLYYNAEDATISDVRPVVPDVEQQLELIYTIAPNSKIALSQHFDYAFRGIFEVFVDDSHYILDEDGWDTLDRQQFEDVAYIGIGKTLNAAIESDVNFSVDRKIDLMKTIRESAGVILIIVGAILMLASAILYVVGRTRIKQDTTSYQAQIEELLQQISELDERYEAKQIPQEIYEKERTNLKSQLSALMSLVNDQ